MTVNWRTIVHTQPMDYCEGMKFGTFFPYLKNRIEIAQAKLPNLPFDCPIKKGKYSGNFTVTNAQNAIATGKNITKKVTLEDHWEMRDGFKMMVLPLPNGIYSNIVHMSTKEDPFVIVVNWVYEKRMRLGENNF
jgi:hypothetical protein